jgi:hypothetical protein
MGSGAVAAILILTLVHFAAFALLFWHLADGELGSVFRLARDDDEGRGGGGGPTEPLDGPRGDRDGGIPLPDAEPARVRLREPRRIGDDYPRRPRRPDHAPAPEREPAVTSPS